MSCGPKSGGLMSGGLKSYHRHFQIDSSKHGCGRRGGGRTTTNLHIFYDSTSKIKELMISINLSWLAFNNL